MLNIVKKYSHILECKKADAVSWREKDDAWIRLSNEFHANCPSIHRRTMDHLRKFYENKNKAAEERISLYATGGGSGVNTCNDPTYDLTISIINK